ncbi:transglutaminase-like domain-containing protein, partial [Zhenhengia sp.]|uniref:transglutaminase-like domain-containing protein n=1 Tax=Zhenhengia sp. TaxID=2944208 RepID=UPI0030791810
MFSASRALQIEERFEELIPLLGDKKVEILEGLKSCSKDESLAMKFLYTTMPLSDVACYSFEVFLDYAKHGLYLWERDAWHIPEDIFLNYVLHHRINEEEIMPCRSFFYNQLKDRVVGKSIQESILEVNYWCSEEATYQSTDERTVAPLTVYKSAYGRCGEESTFTVSALRSVGVPARQVYAPRWSHCDDNHAWVEVWCEGEWYFLGACEPEEILNKGWFTSASSRAMLIHSRWFDFIAPADEEEIEHKGMATLLNQLQRYALTKKLTVKVVDDKGKAVSHARVDFEVLNYAEFYPVASVWTNEGGEASLITGFGSLHLHVSKEEQSADILINTKDVDRITIDLSQSVIRDEWIELEVIAPLDAPIHTQQPTYSQKFTGKKRCSEATKKRLEKVASFQNKDEV